jgi:hypothetical protein
MAEKIPGVRGQRPRVASVTGVEQAATDAWCGQITMRSVLSRLMASLLRS